MTLPIPRLTATLLPAIGRQPREVVLHEGSGWERRLSRALGPPHEDRRKNPRCTACSQSGHNSRSPSCPERRSLAEFRSRRSP